MGDSRPANCHRTPLRNPQKNQIDPRYRQGWGEIEKTHNGQRMQKLNHDAFVSNNSIRCNDARRIGCTQKYVLAALTPSSPISATLRSPDLRFFDFAPNSRSTLLYSSASCNFRNTLYDSASRTTITARKRCNNAETSHVIVVPKIHTYVRAFTQKMRSSKTGNFSLHSRVGECRGRNNCGEKKKGV